MVQTDFLTLPRLPDPQIPLVPDGFLLVCMCVGHSRSSNLSPSSVLNQHVHNAELFNLLTVTNYCFAHGIITEVIFVFIACDIFLFFFFFLLAAGAVSVN